MKTQMLALSGLAVVAALAIAPRASAGGPSPQRPAPSPRRESPFACCQSALSPAERKQHFDEYGPKLRALLKDVRELPNGYEFGFDPRPATYQMLSTWMFQERLCCPFFDLGLRIDREGGLVWLSLTGRNGTKEFIEAELGPWLAKGKG